MTAPLTAPDRAPAPLPGAAADTVLLANALRALAMDAVQAANSGHPGMPMGMAEIAVALWRRHLRHNPANPRWPDRDRFVLSNGHGSMLQYALLHLTGYALPLEELKRFRQLNSKTPGHPEVGVTPGVETTTGPLGQGLANAVGMALAERLLAAEFNRPGHAIVDHRCYAFVGDGCLMEGISHEACSLAGTLALAKLTVFYDDNGISIDGETKGWFTDDTPRRFAAYGWHVIPNVDGHDVEAVDAAIRAAHAVTERPTLIVCKTVIGKGSPNRAGTELAHGQALGEAEVALTREALGWRYPPFEIPREAYEGWDARDRGSLLEGDWTARFAAYRAAHPERAAEFERRTVGALPAGFAERAAALLRAQAVKAESVATRKASQQALEVLAPALPELIGGAADLTGSVLTTWSGSKTVTATEPGNYVYFGVREFAMSAIANGLSLHGGFIPYVGTFLTFSDYARNAVRLAALMRLRAIFVYTHDSIGLGEDGPTHQPIEHAASLRLIPNLELWRPCDTVETAVAWARAIERADGPTCLLFTRQNVPFQKRDEAQTAAIRRGAYVLADWHDAPGERVVLIATGSEVALAMAARVELAKQGFAARVVSMPCTSVFDRQDEAYREAVLPAGARRVAIEAGVSDYWRKYVGLEGAVVGIDRFGESAPAAALFKHFGFTVDHVVATVKRAHRGACA
ncbi:MAG TPA: transketolase [Casimicrobiaceae bacterium]|nr:transketolase [Casimicrobiaceae bacterium]